MKALLLCAGEGRRLLPLTLATPKPMLPINDKPLVQYHIDRLRDVGVTDIVINTYWLADKLVDYFGDGSRFGVRINWSHEDQLLETGGGICNALNYLGDAPFLVINGDVWTDYPFENLLPLKSQMETMLHLVLVPNPPQHPFGDFGLENGRVVAKKAQLSGYTFSGISVIRPSLFQCYPVPEKAFPMSLVYNKLLHSGEMSGELYNGCWVDVGTPQRYEQLKHRLANG